MNSKELVAQATAKIEKMCNLTDKIVAIEDILNVSGDNTEIALYHAGEGTTRLTLVLAESTASKLKELAMTEIILARNKQAEELKQMIGSSLAKVKADPVEEKLGEILQAEAARIEEKTPTLDESQIENVRRMYHDEAKTMKEIAFHYGVTKSQMNTYISKYKLRRTSYNKGDYMDPIDKKVAP